MSPTERPRPRHAVSERIIRNLHLVFRYSPGRDAYVLRLIGQRHGPVLKKKD
jgi:hypothetical protein